MEDDSLTQSYITLKRSIEQFSQPLLPNQIALYAYDMFMSVLDLQTTALFLMEENGFKLVKQQVYGVDERTVLRTRNLVELPLYHAGLMTHHWERWFSADWLETYEPVLIVPLIMKHSLYGWIVSKGNAAGQLDKERLRLAHTLLYLVQSALERSEQQQTIVDLQQQFEKNRYTLMALQTFTASLLTQNSLTTLYDQAVDAFSELARSSVTSLAVWDEFRQRLVVVAFHDHLHRRRQYSEFFLRDNDVTPLLGSFYDMMKDGDILGQIFVSLDDFASLSAKYVILLGKTNVLGFVTLSDSTVLEQDLHFFETIQLLASITYLAILQARRWEELTLQRDLNQHKVQALTTLHHLTENLGLCGDLEELLALVTHTLTVHAKVTRMCIVLQDQNQFAVKSSVGLPPDFVMLDKVLTHFFTETDSTIYDYTAEGAMAWLDGLDIPQDTVTNCLIAVPFWRHQAREFWRPADRPKVYDHLYGCLCVMGMQDGLSEEHFLMIDTIAHNLQPFLRFYELHA